MKFYGFIFLAMMLFGSSCKKAELKKPTKVNFSLGIEKNENQNSDLKFNSGEINLGKFNVSGNRLEGDDIAFSRFFSSGLYSDLNGSAEVKELDYDIPQGEYTDITIDLNILDHGQAPSLIINGSYKLSNGPNVGVRFEFYGNQEMKIIGQDINGAGNIVMDKDLGKKVNVLFDPAYWFESITPNQLDNADLTSGQGQNKIIISPTENTDIYFAVAARISLSNTASFK